MAETGVKIDAVVIGRNEGARLVACLDALQGQVRRMIYVDSGSTDGSVDAARAAGATVVALDMTQPFTAARARNAGLDVLASDAPDFVQLLDGDCQMQPGWLPAALAAFAAHPLAVVVCGRRRERFPEASVYNALADREWDTPIGQALACGGDALMRFAAVRAVGGYNPALIAGEEPDLCLRLRAAGFDLGGGLACPDFGRFRFALWLDAGLGLSAAMAATCAAQRRDLGHILHHRQVCRGAGRFGLLPEPHPRAAGRVDRIQIAGLAAQLPCLHGLTRQNRGAGGVAWDHPARR